jgi:hypothetical protein
LRVGRSDQGRRLLEFYWRNGFIVSPTNELEQRQREVDELQGELEQRQREIDQLQGELEQRQRESHERDERGARLLDVWEGMLDRMPPPSYEDLTEEPPDSCLPPLDRKTVDLTSLSEDQRQWREHGYVIKNQFIPNELLDGYWAVRSKVERPLGWDCPVPYMHLPAVMDLSTYRPLTDLLGELIGEPAAVSLNLTANVSTERNWHQDDYLNPPNVNGWYVAVWMAVDDINPDSGPFEFVPGSHRWPVLRGDRVRLFIPRDRRDLNSWPKDSEAVLNDLIEKEIVSRGGQPQTFVAKKGDILIWHARLFHRGSAPNVPGLERRAFIAHYMGVSHWWGAREVQQHTNGSYYSVFHAPLDGWSEG